MKLTALLSACNDNYGSLLQTYAFQQYLRKHKVDARIIVYTGRPFLRQVARLFNMPLLRMKMRAVYRDWSARILRPALRSQLLERAVRFKAFREKYLTIAPAITSRRQLAECAQRYDVFIVGSDQLWNPVNVGTDFFTLNFVPDGKLKLSYATSFGVSHIPASLHRKYRHYLRRFDRLSTREKSGQTLIRDLAQRDAAVVCDPTLLQERDFWDTLKGEAPIVAGEYIFCYFIGSRADVRAHAMKFREKTGLPIVVLPHIDEYVKSDVGFGDRALYDVGPAEFVNLIAHATYVLTDSFHGTVFSLLYGKRFYTYNRFRSEGGGSMNSRISSLLEIAGAPERRVEVDRLVEELLGMEPNSLKIDQNLAQFREQSIAYVSELIACINE